MISVLAIGKKHDTWIREGLERYTRRLRKPWDVQWILLPHSAHDRDAARQEESERILTRIDAGDYVILLDETGQLLSSPELADLCERQFSSSRPITIIIGGAYGVDARVHTRADRVISLARLVYPHQLVRLILIEQIYRCQEISRGGDYHHA